MTKESVFVAYLKAWGLIAIAAASFFIMEVSLADIVFGNPNRTRSDTIDIIIFMTPLMALICALIVAWVMIPSQVLQALTASKLGLSRYTGLLTFPSAFLTWFSYDYLTPSYFTLGINEGADWHPFEHGVTLTRYMFALCLQFPVTFFNVTYATSNLAKSSTRKAVAALFLGSVILGCCAGVASAITDKNAL